VWCDTKPKQGKFSLFRVWGKVKRSDDRTDLQEDQTSQQYNTGRPRKASFAKKIALSISTVFGTSKKCER